MSPEKRHKTAQAYLVLLSIALVAFSALFLTLDAKGSWSFVLSFRGERLLSLILVACAMSAATVLFHTVVNNQILTPSVMGLDALFVLIQTSIVFSGAGDLVLFVDPTVRFLLELAAMVLFSLMVFLGVFRRLKANLHLVMMVGIVLGVLFRSLSGLMQRMLDPATFIGLQDLIFASFGSVDAGLLYFSVVLIVGLMALIARTTQQLDVLRLGPNVAKNLGINVTHLITTSYILVVLLVSISTALVGPVPFFGLLIAHLTYRLVPGAGHLWTLLLASLLGATLLVAGQTVLERVLGFEGALGMIVEITGGILFLALVIRKPK